MKQKIAFFILLVLLLGSGYFILVSNQDRIKPIDCNIMGAVYLLPSERDQASFIANHINGVVVIPETNELIARSEILDCENFEPSDYIDIGGI